MSRMLIAASWMLIVLGLCSCGNDPESSNIESEDGGSSTQNALPPSAGTIVDEMLELYRKLDSVSFTVERTDVFRASGRETTKTNSRVIDLMKPNRIRVRATSPTTSKLVAEYICDKGILTTYSPSRNQFITGSTSDSYPGILDDYASHQILGDGGHMVLQFLADKIDPFVMRSFKSAKYVGRVQIGGIDCYHLTVPNTETSVGWDFWVSAGNEPFLMQVQSESTVPLVEDLKKTSTDRFSSWERSPEFSSSHFAFVPPSGTEHVENWAPDPEERALKERLDQMIRKNSDPVNAKTQPSSGNPVIDFFRSVDRGVKSTTPKPSNPSPAKPDDARNPFDDQ